MKPESPWIQGECCDHGGEGPTVYDLPVPLSLRQEWKRLATSRHFLGRMGKTLGWAGLTSLLGSRIVGRAAAAELTGGGEAATLNPAVPGLTVKIIFMSEEPDSNVMGGHKTGHTFL